MAFNTRGVHVIEQDRETGRNVLTGRNPYTRFIKEGEVPHNVQKGKFWSDGGDNIPVEELPDWVKLMVQGMTPAARKNVGLGDELPWEAVERKPKDLSSPEVRMSVLEAVQLLDPHNDEDWTSDGKPSVDAVSRHRGKYTSRNDVEKSTSGFRRPER